MSADLEFHLGFTGSRRGLTEHQREMLAQFLSRQINGLRGSGLAIECVLHHGDCLGADFEAHAIAIAEGWTIELHPGLDSAGASPNRGFAEDADPSGVRQVHEPAPYGQRNVDIVLAGMLLLACPDGPEQRRSGTWSTVRAARRLGRNVVLIPPEDDPEFLGEHEHAE